MSAYFKPLLWSAALVAVVVLLAAAYDHLGKRAAPSASRNFQECALESGITFRMNFLSNEQGVALELFRVNLYDHGSGVAVGDYDGDGHDDLYLVNQLGRNALYKNQGDGTFVDVTQQAGVGLGDRICVAATFADYDNDGHQDLFVTSTRGGNVLFRNLGNGAFQDVTQKAGLTHVGHSQAAVFFDYDNDGYLDLLVTNTAQWTTDTFDTVRPHYVGKGDMVPGSAKEFNILYHNNRDGTFTDVTDKAGMKGQGWGGDCAVFDYDEDGYLDVLVTCMFGPSQLFRNRGNGTFTDVTAQVLGRTPAGSMGAKAFDFNNDGKLDLYIVDMHSDMWVAYNYPELVHENKKNRLMTVRDGDTSLEALLGEKMLADLIQLPYDRVAFGNLFYKNQGKGKFVEVGDRANTETFWPWGIATGDFDNDGYEDVFVASGMGYPFFYWPNRLLMNNGDETFSERSEANGIEPPARGIYQERKIGGRPASRSSRCAATADFDGDGRLDLIVNNFNDAPYYFKNQFPQKNYVAFRLRGTRSNRDAIGAVVRLYAGKAILTRQVHPASGYLAQSSKTVHFGLGERASIDRVEIRWPSGRRQVLDHPRINTLHTVVEPEPGEGNTPVHRKG